MAAARIVVGLLFIIFAEYKLVHPDFAHGGYQKTVTGYVQETALGFYVSTDRSCVRRCNIRWRPVTPWAWLSC
jgi:hypothetical protein